MTDTAYDAVQRLHSRRLVRSSNACSSLSTKKEKDVALCVCGLGSAAAVIVTAVSLGVYFSSRGGQGQETSELWELFYPPEEAQELARYVNTSLNPCRDFFAYVCSSAINDAHSTRGDVDAELVRMAITGATPTSVEKGPVGRLLTRFYGTCVETVPHRETFVAGMATALARSTWGRLGVPDTRNALVYVVTVSVKYDLPSAVRVTLERLRSVMLLKMGAVCGAERHTDLFEAALSASREALRAHDKATPSSRDAEDVKDLRLKSCERFAGVIIERATYTLANESDAFDREVWNVGDLHAALRAIGRPLQSVERVVVEGVRQIRILHDVFASDEVAVDVKAAYLVWESIARAAEKFYTRDVSSALGVFDKCVEGLFHVPHIWDVFAAEVIASAAKEVDARETFQVVKDAVSSDCQRSSLFEPDDAEGLHRFFNELTLVTPAEAGKTRVTVPEPRDSFAENLLLLRACEFEMASLSEWDLSEVLIPDIGFRLLDDRHLLMSPSVYAQIRTGSPDRDIVNFLRVGRSYAESIWYMALNVVQWSPKTRANIDSFRECLAEHYFGEADSGSEVDELAVAALGMSSIVNALMGPDWNVLKPMWSSWKVSRSQFVYTLSSYYRCPKARSPRSMRLINAPLTYVGDFGESFGCASTSPMTKPPRCPLQKAPRA